VSNKERLNKPVVKTYAFDFGIFLEGVGVDLIKDLIKDKALLLGSVGSSGSGDAGADDNELLELILDSICRSSDRNRDMG
jgi:hypothetical protein